MTRLSWEVRQGEAELVLARVHTSVLGGMQNIEVPKSVTVSTWI